MSEPKSMTKVDKYVVLNKINEGMSGIVYRVESDHKEFALKLLKSASEDTIARFRKESSTLARLHHDCMVRIYDVGEFQGKPYFVMEYLTGDILSKAISLTSSGLNEELSLRVVRSVAQALSELHKNNLIHRDIKPSNIILTDEGRVKLIDLGLVGDVEQVKFEMALVGTPLYCSPEQSKVLKQAVDFRSDLYSLGVTFYECVCGKLPFTGSVAEILQQHASKVAPEVRGFNGDVRPAIAVILKKLLAKDPDDRYQSALGLIADLDRLDDIDDFLKKKVDPGLGAKDRNTRTVKTKFIERTAEVRRLSLAWNVAQTERATVAVVSGPSGSGKSRLCDEFVNSVETENILVLRGKCQVFDADLPFGPIREAFENLFDDISTFQDGTQKQWLARIATAAEGSESYLTQLTASFKKALGKSVQGADAAGNSNEQRSVFFTKISRFFLELGKQWTSVIFLIDDLQWIDKSSLELLNRVFESAGGARIMLLGTARDDDASLERMKLVDEYFSEFIDERVNLSQFTREQMQALICGYLGTDQVNPRISDVLNSKSNGNPFIAIEFLRSGMEQGYIYFKDNIWGLEEKDLEKISLSENVYKMIVKRIDTCAPEARKIIQIAALSGNVFKALDVAAVGGVDPADLEPVLRQFQSLGLIDKQAANKWKFSHDKVVESIKSALSVQQVEDIALSLARFYENKAEKSADEIFSLARLYSLVSEGSVIRETMLANLAAGKLAFINFAHVEATRYLQTAYHLTKKHHINDPVILSELTSKLSISAAMIADWELATECSSVYCKLSENNENRFDSQGVKTWVHRNRGDVATAWDYFRKACDTLDEPYPWYLQWKVIETLCLGLLAYVSELLQIEKLPSLSFKSKKNIGATPQAIVSLYYEGHSCTDYLNTLLDNLLIALKLTIKGKVMRDPVALGYGYRGMASFLKCLGPTPLVNVYCEKAEALYPRISDQSVIAKIDSGIFISRFIAGVIRVSETDYGDKWETAKKYLPPTEYGMFLNYFVFFYTVNGEFKKCLSLINKCLSDHKRYVKRVSEQNLNVTNHFLWLSLSNLGMAQAAQAAKKTAMHLNNRMRFLPNASRLALHSEIQSKRYSCEADARAYEMMEVGLKDHAYLSTFTTQKYNESTYPYIALLLLEQAKTNDEYISLKRKFTRSMTRLHLTCYNPMVKINYYYLLARYYKFLKRDQAAEFLYDSAEKIAKKVQCTRILFDIYVDHARAARENENSFQLHLYLTSAYQLASQYGWKPNLDKLKVEFAEHLDQISLGAATTGVNTVQSSTVMGSSGMASQTIMASREMSTHTVSGRSSRISASATATSTVASSTVMGSGTMNTVHDQTEVGSIRFVEALLNVSTAFVSSINPFEQANSVLNQIVKLFAAERGYLFTNDEQTGELSLLTGKGADGSTLTQLTGYSRTVVRKANETGKAVLVSGTDEAEAIGSESAVLHNLRSIIATPLIAKDKVVGVVYLDSKLTKGLFSQGDVELFSTLANHIGVALELSRSANMEREQAKLRHQLDIQTAVSAEATKVKVLADNMQQALFSIEKGGTIVEPVSKFTEHLLGGKIVGKNLLDVLYRNLPRDDKQKFDGVQNALNMVFGEDELQWDLISDQFPHECTHSDKTERILKVQPSPIWSNEQTVEKIVFVVEDVTQMEEMKRQIQNQQVQAAMLEEMLKSDLKEVSNFINGISSTIVTMKAAAGETTLAGLADLLRDVHTLKGNARLYKMINLSKQVHESESVIVPLKGKGELVDADRQLIAAELGKIAAMIGSYKKISDQLFNSSSKESSTGAINAFALGALKKAIDQFDQSTADEQVYKVRRAFDRLQFKSVADLTSQYKPMVMDISAQLGKMVNLQVEGEALVSVDQASVLKDCLLHLLRNSIDHGLETTEDRVKSNKAEAGTVKVSCHDDGETVVIAISDDGRGIDVDRVASVAVERGLLTREQADGMSHDQKLDLIFLDGFSSKSEATDISGRGIGMSVVRESLSRMGASLKLDTKLGAGTSFTITLTQKVQGVELAA